MRSRRWELIIDDTVVIAETDSYQFRTQFDVSIDSMGHISYLDMIVSNLTEDTANKFFKKNAVIGLRAGYADSIDYIFKGRIRNVLREREGATTNTRIIARGGDLDRVKINASLGKNTKLSKILETIAEAMGYPLVYTASDFTDEYVTGYSMTGNAEEYLSELAETHSFEWVIENSKLVIFSAASERKSTVIEYDMFNGLEGIPELTEVGIDFSVRLSPKLKIGAKIKVTSEFKTFNYSNVYFQDVAPNAGSGEYAVFKIQHSGDNYGNTWTSKVTGYRSSYSESNK